MPKIYFKMLFLLMMSFLMVYVMICYNISLNIGGMSKKSSLWLLANEDRVPVAFLLEFFIVDKLAHALCISWSHQMTDRLLLHLLFQP